MSVTSTALPESRATPQAGPAGRAGRRAATRAGRERGWWFTVGGLVLAAVAAWWVTNSGIFAMRSLSVTGTRHLSAQSVALTAGVSDRTNLFWLDPEDIELRLERDPWILDARVSRTLPGTLRIAVEERRPVAVLSPGWLWVARDGTVLGPADPTRRLPDITIPGRPIHPGGRVDASTPSLRVAAGLPVGIRSDVGSVRLDRDGLLTLVLRDGVRVMFGDASDTRRKGRTLQAVLEWGRANGVRPRAIDVSAPGSPALSPWPGTTAHLAA